MQNIMKGLKMPVQIVKKSVSVPKTLTEHDAFIPLRVVSGDAQYKYAKNGDIIIKLLHDFGGFGAFNCTQASLMCDDDIKLVKCFRAYEIESVYICNDDTPAPVVST